MYNYLVERMYQEYETVTDQNNIHFVRNGKVVGTLYRKEQVLNIFLSASRNVVWNYNKLALFVVAKKYAVLNNSKMRNTEAAWLIGSCGAEKQYTLKNPMYLDSGLYFRDWQVSCMARVNKGNGCVKFKLFDMEIEYRKNKQPCCNGNYLNPALVYPVKSGGKKVKNAKAYLRKSYDWAYGIGYQNVGSRATREFIDTKANKTNHTELSEIRYNIIRK
ncbi:hypothetical protein EGR52_06975 [bacterium]|nr:hypothetical protein [bacterium]